MNQRAVSGAPFVPFELPPGAEGGAAHGGNSLKMVPKGEGAAHGDEASGFAPFQLPGAAHAHAPAAGKPVVILQREGDRVTGIRVECQCGQVIELACSY